MHPNFTSELKSNHGFSRGAIKNESLHKNAVKIASLCEKKDLSHEEHSLFTYDLTMHIIIEHKPLNRAIIINLGSDTNCWNVKPNLHSFYQDQNMVINQFIIHRLFT